EGCVGAGGGDEGGGTGDRFTVDTTRPPSLVPRPVALQRRKSLLLLVLEGEPWKARVLEAVDPEEIEFPPYRAVFEALAEDAPERLDETAARACELLKAEGLAGRAPDELFERAVNWIEARRLE